MAGYNPNLITMSMATQGSTPAGTWQFMTRDYQPPAQGRSLDTDTVHNQNGVFKYVYDNGPNVLKWAPFQILCQDAFATILGGSATIQYARLQALWNHRGLLGFKGPADVARQVHWAAEDMQNSFSVFPRQVGDKIEYEVVVQIEQG